MGIAAKKKIKKHLVKKALRHAGIRIKKKDHCVRVSGPLGSVKFCFKD